ncbi:MAG: hypothetical protein KAI55_02840, partial [Candidatus Aenigmarchaeota archaeon]|nr:hypothetical protein [Candidatus Aenigmarchaeota archaeon]
MMVKKTLKRQIKSDYFKDELFNSLPIFPTNSKEHISLEDNGLKINLPAICFFRVDSLLNKF